MESIGDMLAKQRTPEPPEIAIIKRFIRDAYNKPASVLIQQRQIVISVPGAALAGALRPRLLELQRLCSTDKRLIIRIER